MPWLGSRAAYTFGAPVLSLAGAATTIVAPLLLNPSRFGDYILLLSIFQYASICDLGLSQLADRLLSANGGSHATSVASLVWSRLIIAAGLLIFAGPLTLALAQSGGDLTPTNILLATAGGAAFMLSNGPVTIYRARSQVWDFSFAALLMQAGLSGPRLAGLVFGGITGCFASLAAWYALTGVLLNQPLAVWLRRGTGASAVVRTISAALPLFAFNGLWLLYLTANRWVASFLCGPTEFGLFAFGANLVTVGIFMLTSIGQVYYPKHLSGTGTIDAQARLCRELVCVVGVAAAGGAAGIFACRYAVPVAFPQFAAAAGSSAAVLASGVPLGMAGWLMPLLVAQSRRPWRDAAVLFSVSFVALGLATAAGQALGGIEGQSWGCVVGALVVTAMQLRLAAHLRIMRPVHPAYVFAAVCGGVILAALIWVLLF